MASILLILIISFSLILIVINIPILGFLPFILWGAMGWATQAPQQHILLQNHNEHGGAAVALNSSINYLGSAIGSATGGIILANFSDTNVLIYGAIIISIIGISLQAMNVIINKERI